MNIYILGALQFLVPICSQFSLLLRAFLLVTTVKGITHHSATPAHTFPLASPFHIINTLTSLCRKHSPAPALTLSTRSQAFAPKLPREVSLKKPFLAGQLPTSGSGVRKCRRVDFFRLQKEAKKGRSPPPPPPTPPPHPHPLHCPGSQANHFPDLRPVLFRGPVWVTWRER